MGYHGIRGDANRNPRGSAMLWVLTFVAVITVVMTAAAPLVVGAKDTADVRETADILRELATGIDSFNLYVKRGGPSFTTPNDLTQLTSPVVSGDPAGCSTQTYNNTAAGAWLTYGPFVPHVFPTTGLWTPLGRINTTPSRTPTAVGSQRTSSSDPYYIQMESVDVRLARMLDAYVDGTADPSADTVQYTAPAADSTVTLSYDATLARLPAC